MMSKENPNFAKKELDLFQIYAEDPELADKLVFGRAPVLGIDR